MTITPHAVFNRAGAEDVVLCWEDIPQALYAKLCNEIIPLQNSIQAILLDQENLAAIWSKFTPAEQQLLNDLAEAQEAHHWKLDWSNANEDNGYKPRKAQP